jgi:hypothetical protein
MPSVFVNVPQFYNVPVAPGVPQMVRSVLNAAALLLETPVLQTQAPPGVIFGGSAAQRPWMLVNAAGNPVLGPDSFMELKRRGGWAVGTYPVQRGSFADYDKVTKPKEYSVRMVKGGSLTDRQAFEQACDDVASALELFTLITPERSYVGINVTDIVVSRIEASGANFIDAEMFFREIREVDAQYSSTTINASTANAQNPGAVPPQSLGLVQTQPTTPSVENLVNNALGIT